MMTMPFDSGISVVRADTGCVLRFPMGGQTRGVWRFPMCGQTQGSAPTVGGGHCFSISMPSPASMQRFFMLS